MFESDRSQQRGQDSIVEQVIGARRAKFINYNDLETARAKRFGSELPKKLKARVVGNVRAVRHIHMNVPDEQDTICRR